MFGHQNDIITQDQKKDASVAMSENDLDALTTVPAATPLSDDSDDTASDDQTAADDTKNTEDSTPSTRPYLFPTSIDGFTAPSTKLASPFAYMQDSSAAANDKPAAAEPEGIDLDPVSEDAVSTTTEEDAPEEDDAKADVDEPAASSTEPEPTDTPASEPSAPPVATTNVDHLLTIKQEALSELSPLVDQLSLEPEERFHTLMMLIRASDNETLIGDAHEAAKAIPDAQIRAKALLDLVNEINYFTGNQSLAA